MLGAATRKEKPPVDSLLSELELLLDSRSTDAADIVAVNIVAFETLCKDYARCHWATPRKGRVARAPLARSPFPFQPGAASAKIPGRGRL